VVLAARCIPAIMLGMIRKYVGDKKSIEAKSENGRIWTGVLSDAGRQTKFSEATLKEVDDLAAKHRMRLVSPK
jgi:hypothetical protein